jgi:hypothetical protein
MRSHPKHEVADIFNSLTGSQVSSLRLSPDKRRVFRAITRCRTAELGAHVHGCKSCGYREQSYNSCLNRHCPKCRGGVSFEWVQARREELLPVSYYHVVFTLPSELRQLCYANKRLMYDLLFRASNEALCAAAQRREQLKLGSFGILHTWNQELQYHPHVHYVVAAGGLSADGRWRNFTNGSKFFLPVRVLSKIFRGIFIAHLKRANNAGKLFFPKHLSHLANPRDFEHLVSRAARHDWVVYAKRPFASPEHVIKYLGSYVHRVAISNSRLRSVSSTEVRYAARDPKRKDKKRIRTLTPEQFTKRFLQHVLPRSFKRIRYFGFMTNEKRAATLTKIRAQLKVKPPTPTANLERRCPKCPTGILAWIPCLNPHRTYRFPSRIPQKITPLGLSPSPPLSLALI